MDPSQCECVCVCVSHIHCSMLGFVMTPGGTFYSLGWKSFLPVRVLSYIKHFSTKITPVCYFNQICVSLLSPTGSSRSSAGYETSIRLLHSPNRTISVASINQSCLKTLIITSCDFPELIMVTKL